MRKCLLLLILLFLVRSGFADTFIVTSNADNGPGTLRDAIELANANGTAVADQIHFNIPNTSAAGRTITLLSYLPSLTSNMVLDAGTQPGAYFGVSSAKIRITTNTSESYSQCFILRNVQDIEIYGFYITNFRYGDPNIDVTRCAIWMQGIVKNIKIGAPGKGNVFFNNGLAICTPYGYSSNEGHHFSDIDIKSNFFNLDINGTTFTRYDAWTCILISSFTNLTIGGENEADGNFFAGLNGNAAELISDNNTGNGVLNVKNNKFGFTFDQSSAVPCGALVVTGYEFSMWNQTRSDLEVNIVNNKFRNPPVQFSNSCHGMVILSRIVGFITITGNSIGSPDGYGDCQTSAISLLECKDGIIGGDNPEEQNVISSSSYAGIVVYDNENITIRKNTIVCNSKGIEAASSVTEIPDVKIMETNDVDYVAGTATPNCKIEVFQNIKQCLQCNNGEVYMGETLSDAGGNWSFSGAFFGPVTARATSATGASGEFSAAKFTEPVEYKHPVCDKENGYIKGIQFISGTRYYWIRRYNGQSDTTFNQLDLTDIGPGLYTFVVEQTKYCSKTYNLNLFDNSPEIRTTYLRTIHPSCGQPNGKILDASITGDYDKVYWISSIGDTASHISELTDVLEGQYKLVALNTQYGCGDSTAYYTLTNQSGPTLNLNNIQITSATCGNSNGSITGITVNNHIGNIHIEWRDSLNNYVGSSFNLLNQPAGKYLLKYKDDSGCDTIITPYYIIPSIGVITIDTTGKKVVPAGCTVLNGQIADIMVAGANNWQWKNMSDDAVVGNAVDVSSLKSGSYQLTATNQYGCTKTSPVIAVPAATFASIEPINPVAVNAACGENNGSVQISGFTQEATLASYKWINSNSQVGLGSQLGISGLGEGKYELIATDTNGCVKTVFYTDIKVNAKPQIEKSAIKIVNDKCELKQAGITGLRIVGLANLPTYTWYDENGIVVSTSLELSGVGAGNYRLTVKDGSFCTITSDVIAISNDNTVSKPEYDDIVIPINTTTTLKVNNPGQGNYSLYADPAATQIIDQNPGGTFDVSVLNSDKKFYIKFINGACVSPVEEVKVTVVDKSEFAVPNAFTPNDDDLNDILHVKVLGYIELEYFKIFNRFGKQVFFSKNVNDGWNGTVNGVIQPPGVFIWMARGKDLLGKIIESKGTIVLIR